MENSEKQNPLSGKTSSRNQYVSAEQLIAKMKIAFSNAKQPEILAELTTVGITEAQLDGYLADIANLEQLSQQQIQEYGEQYAETDKFNLKKAEIDQIYARHRNLAKIVFKEDRQANSTMGITAGRKQAYPAWYQQVSNFYAQIVATLILKPKPPR